VVLVFVFVLVRRAGRVVVLVWALVLAERLFGGIVCVTGLCPGGLYVSELVCLGGLACVRRLVCIGGAACVRGAACVGPVPVAGAGIGPVLVPRDFILRARHRRAVSRRVIIGLGSRIRAAVAARVA
jgi:hypothetical protein